MIALLEHGAENGELLFLRAALLFFWGGWAWAFSLYFSWPRNPAVTSFEFCCVFSSTKRLQSYTQPPENLWGLSETLEPFCGGFKKSEIGI